MFPTLAGLAGAGIGGAEGKPLDGVDVWPLLGAKAAPPRSEVVYNVEPYRAAVREGDWKLVWTALLPPKAELFDLSVDPGETTDLSAANPEKTAELQARVLALAAESAPPAFLGDGQATNDELGFITDYQVGINGGALTSYGTTLPREVISTGHAPGAVVAVVVRALGYAARAGTPFVSSVTIPIPVQPYAEAGYFAEDYV